MGGTSSIYWKDEKCIENFSLETYGKRPLKTLTHMGAGAKLQGVQEVQGTGGWKPTRMP
jgi:hypothetical protein